MGSVVRALMRLVMKPARPPTQGPARIPPRIVPIESRKRGSLRPVAIACPAQSIAMQTGMRTMPSVFSRNLKADSQGIAGLPPALSIGRSDKISRMATDRARYPPIGFYSLLGDLRSAALLAKH